MSALSKLGSTSSALFGSISTAADTVTDSINVLAKGVGMANTWVVAASERQIIETELEMESFEDTAVLRHQAETAKTRKEILDRIKSDPSLLEAFNELDGAYENARKRIALKLGRSVPTKD